MTCPFIGGGVGVATAAPFIVVVGVQVRARGRETFSLLAPRGHVPPFNGLCTTANVSVRAACLGPSDQLRRSTLDYFGEYIDASRSADFVLLMFDQEDTM